MARGITKMTASKFRSGSKRVSPSTKSSKSPQPVFGKSSQFAGVGRGKPGDPRK